MNEHSARLVDELHTIKQQVARAKDLRLEGRLTRIVGLTLEGVGLSLPVGGHCLIESAIGDPVDAEVIGFEKDKTYLMCNTSTQGLTPGATITPTYQVSDVEVGDALIGRVIDGAGEPIDGKPLPLMHHKMPLLSEPINPLNRARIDTQLDVGVRAINGLLCIGRGQRMGLFAGSGVGKSMLLGMMTHFTRADICVVGLVGERGREVKEFIEAILGEQGLARSVVVAAPADTSPLMRLHGAMRATTIAEYFRDQGKHVLLIIDSVTRFAQAARELGLAIGEPPTTKGYPPSVFTKLSGLIERAGNAQPGGGSITAFYTVLSEGDDVNDPVADSARSFLDGHIILTRELAEQGHYPAISVEASISRVVHDIATDEQKALMQKFVSMHATYEANKDLINLGAYQRGSDPKIDLAIDKIPQFTDYLQQPLTEQATIEDSLSRLRNIVNF